MFPKAAEWKGYENQDGNMVVVIMAQTTRDAAGTIAIVLIQSNSGYSGYTLLQSTTGCP
jgi:hypothetical protein